MRGIFIVSGLLALAASGYMAVEASGGIASASAPGLVALVVILAVGAAAIGHAVAGKHVAIAVVIGLGMLAGEAAAMLQTAQRVTAAREAMRAPMAAVTARRQFAADELAKAEAAKPMLADRARLTAAELAKSEADTAARVKSTDKGCRANCRLLLQAAVDSASREVEMARSEIASHDAEQASAVVSRIEKAKAALAALPPPQSATPLADNTGLPEWALDVFEALALSLAINLPASALIALGVKLGAARPYLRSLDAPAATAQTPLNLQLPQLERRDAMAEAERFGIAMLRPDRDARLSASDLRAAYLNWCDATGIQPLPIGEIATALGKLFRKSGIVVDDGAALGVVVKRLDS